jgi:hypothetical protein
LHFFANDLPQGTHSLKLVNGGTSDNRTFFGELPVHMRRGKKQQHL